MQPPVVRASGAVDVPFDRPVTARVFRLSIEADGGAAIAEFRLFSEEEK